MTLENAAFAEHHPSRLAARCGSHLRTTLDVIVHVHIASSSASSLRRQGPITPGGHAWRWTIHSKITIAARIS